ncbi:unnamed protein product [Gadus morhua 'NCC']
MRTLQAAERIPAGGVAGEGEGGPPLHAPTPCAAPVCRLPLQDNRSDCGLYLLQYAESFLRTPWCTLTSRPVPGAPTATRPSEGRPLIPLARRLDGNGGPPTMLLNPVPGEEPSLGVTQRNQGSPRGTRGSPRGTWGHPEEPGVTQGNLGVTQRKPGVTKGNQGVTQRNLGVT